MTLAILLAVLLLPSQDPAAYRIYAGAESRSLEQMLDDLAKADVVVIGENHDHKLGHELEMAILKGVHARKPKMALSLEMFERDVQPVLDEYLAGHITETHFLQSSRPWPNYKIDYAPLVEYARANKLPVIAANAPRRYVNIVSRKGQPALLALPRESKRHLGPLPFAMDLPPAYDQMLTTLFSANHGPGAPQLNVENLKASQALWDATMADSIHQFLRKNRRHTVVQINGAGHSDHGHGLVARLRKSSPGLRIRIVTIKPEAGFPNRPATIEEGIADYLIITAREQPSPSR